MDSSLKNPADVSLRAMRASSRTLFGGAQYRIEIGAAIGRRPFANTAELASELGLSRQSVNQELRILERMGLLHRVDGADDGGRKVFFDRVESDYWNFCAEAEAHALDRLQGVTHF